MVETNNPPVDIVLPSGAMISFDPDVLSGASDEVEQEFVTCLKWGITVKKFWWLALLIAALAVIGLLTAIAMVKRKLVRG